MKTKTIETICESPTLVVESLNGYQGGSYTSSMGYSLGGNFQNAYRPILNDSEKTNYKSKEAYGVPLKELCRGLGKKDTEKAYELNREATCAYEKGDYDGSIKKIYELDQLFYENGIDLLERYYSLSQQKNDR